MHDSLASNQTTIYSNIIAVRFTRLFDNLSTLADDLTVLNVTKDHIEVREVTFNHESWPMGTSKEWDTAPRGEPATGLMSDWLKKGEVKGINPPPTQPID